MCSNEAAETNKLDAVTYHDLQFTYHADYLWGMEFSVGVNNVFDEDPPICLSCSLNGLDASTHDLPGRVWYVRASLEF